MTWTIDNRECWAKFESSNSSIDPNGCAYCQSCFFGKTINYLTHENQSPGINMNFETKKSDSINLMISHFQLTVTGEKKSSLSAVLSAVLGSKPRRSFVTVHYPLVVNYVPAIKA